MAPALGLWLLLFAAQSSPQNSPVADPVYAGLKQSQWIAIARDKSSRRRAEAIDVLGQINPDAVAAIPTLLEALQDRNPEIDPSPQRSRSRDSPVVRQHLGKDWKYARPVIAQVQATHSASASLASLWLGESRRAAAVRSRSGCRV
jgi:hypothetical protein